MKLKIVSDGSAMFTRVVNAETGEPVEGVTSVKWECGIDELISTAQITIKLVSVEVVGAVQEKKRSD